MFLNIDDHDLLTSKIGKMSYYWKTENQARPSSQYMHESWIEKEPVRAIFLLKDQTSKL